MEKDPKLAMMDLVVTQARAAEKLLKIVRNPKKWCQKGLAEDIKGNPIHPLNPGAKKWSFLGAFYKAKLSQQEALAMKILLETPDTMLAQISNELSHADLLELLNHAAKDRAKKEQLREDYCALLVKRVQSIVSAPVEETAHE